MSQIASITMYACPRCERLLKTERGAQGCLDKHLEADKVLEIERQKRALKEERRHSVRMEATCFADIFILLVKYAKEFYALDLTFDRIPNSFDHLVSNTHNAPIGKPTNWVGHGSSKTGLPLGYPGWTGRWEGKIVGKKDSPGEKWDHGREADLGWLFEKLFAGFHTGTGCPGVKFSIGGMIFVDDFPKIKEKYDEFVKLEQAKKDFDSKKEYMKQDLWNKARHEMAVNEKVKTLKERCQKLDKLKGETLREIDAIEVEIEEKYEEIENSTIGKLLYGNLPNFDEKKFEELAKVLKA